MPGRWLIALSGLLLLAAAAPAVAADAYDGPVQLEDGMYTESWFLQSFLDLRDDLEVARDEGKRFVIMWELKGCPYCKETHFVNFGDDDIRHFVRENFTILQLDVQGARQVIDFDGEELEERDLADKYGIRYTPTLQFFPDDPAALDGKEGMDREVARIPGYFRPPHFLAMFRYVHERAYENEGFRDYLKRQSKKS